VVTTLPPVPLDLGSFFEATPERFNRRAVVQRPGLQVLHLPLAPGQGVPPHRHPGCEVLLQGLTGVTTVQLEEDTLTLLPQQLLSFLGDLEVSPRNDSDAPSALLITLVSGRKERP